MRNNLLYNGFRFWWAPLVTGLLSIAVGVFCFIWPTASMATMAIFFECLLLVAGIFNVCYALGNHGPNSHWGWPLANGLIEIVLAIWMWTMPLPELTTVFMYIVGFWVLFMCIYGLSEAAMLNSLRIGWVGWIIGFILIGLVFILVFMMGPREDAVFVVSFLGFSFIFYGLSRIMLSFRLRRYNQTHR